MSSEVDIANLALAHLGDEAGITQLGAGDGTQQAAYCGTYYPLARDTLLEAHPWSFATKRVAIAQTDNPSPDDWSYAYTLPSTCLRPLALLLPGVGEQLLSTDTDAGSHPYLVESNQDGSPVLYTNVEGATLRYIDGIKDPNRFTPGFTVALARLLASYLAGPVLKGATGMQVAQAQYKLFLAEFASAAARDANTGHRASYRTHVPSFLAARGGLSVVPDARIIR